MPSYQMKWFHRLLCKKLDEFLNGDIQRLMVFMPPQHGKSELTSRRFPAYALGQNPDLKIAGCSYNSTFASGFNRSIQRIIDDKIYGDIFPETTMNRGNIKTTAKGGYLRNSEIFEVVGYQGFYRSCGVGSALTGTPVDIGIIDDPYKDKLEAYSQTIRENVWDWYENVFETRLHNFSKELIILTRWHHDDLAGRLLKIAHEDPKAKQWEVLSLPALREESITHPDDTREYREALWEERHSKEKLERVEKRSPTVFNSLYQQRPTAAEGNLIKEAWFPRFTLSDLPANYRVRFTGDGAFTEKEENDATALLAYVYDGYFFNVLDIAAVRMEMPDLLEFIPDFIRRNDPTMRGIMKFEPKANGKSVVQMFKRPMYNKEGKRRPAINIKESKAPTVDKVARLMSQVDVWESGRIRLLKGASWIPGFLEEGKQFPRGEHDDRIDAAMIMVDEHTTKKKATVSGVRRKS